MSNLSHAWQRTGAALAAAGLAALVDPSPASACSCAGPLEVEAALASADVVFEGTPRSTALLEADLGFEGYRGARRFDFEVVRYFKGQLGPSLSIFTIDQSTACGRQYSEQTYFIYARYTDTGYLMDNACSSSGPVALSSGARSTLGEGVAPDPTLLNEWSSPSGEGSAPTAPGVSSGVNRVPLDPDEGPRGCASLAEPRRPPSPTAWLVLLGGAALVALHRVRRSR